jgi:hypothetical protein
MTNPGTARRRNVAKRVDPAGSAPIPRFESFAKEGPDGRA